MYIRHRSIKRGESPLMSKENIYICSKCEAKGAMIKLHVYPKCAKCGENKEEIPYKGVWWSLR